MSERGGRGSGSARLAERRARQQAADPAADGAEPPPAVEGEDDGAGLGPAVLAGAAVGGGAGSAVGAAENAAERVRRLVADHEQRGAELAALQAQLRGDPADGEGGSGDEYADAVEAVVPAAGERGGEQRGAAGAALVAAEQADQAAARQSAARRQAQQAVGAAGGRADPIFADEEWAGLREPAFSTADWRGGGGGGGGGGRPFEGQFEGSGGGVSAVPYDPGFERPGRLHSQYHRPEVVNLYRRGEYARLVPGWKSLSLSAQYELEYWHPITGRIHDVFCALQAHNASVPAQFRVGSGVLEELNEMFILGEERIDGQKDRARAAAGESSGGFDVEAALDLLLQLRDERMDRHEFGGTYGAARERIANLYAYQKLRQRVSRQVWRGGGGGAGRGDSFGPAAGSASAGSGAAASGGAATGAIGGGGGAGYARGRGRGAGKGRGSGQGGARGRGSGR
jgi:hypothetical protein